MDEIILPTVRAHEGTGTPFKRRALCRRDADGAGTQAVEYNVRFGDPECQVLMLRMMSDIVPALLAPGRRTIEEFRPALVSPSLR